MVFTENLAFSLGFRIILHWEIHGLGLWSYGPWVSLGPWWTGGRGAKVGLQNRSVAQMLATEVPEGRGETGSVLVVGGAGRRGD
jgi:hypothetical protein